MKKRILSLLLTVLMIISLFSAFSINASAAGSITITSLPVVLFGGGGEYNIVWRTSAKSIGYVTYRFGGKSYTVYDEKNGVVRSDDDTHTVRVPQEHLDAAGAYEVYSIAVDSRTDYNINLSVSTSVSSSFTGYHNQKEIKFAIFSDTHLEPKNKKTMQGCKDALDNYMHGADVIVLNGDIPNNMPTEDYFDLILETARTLSGGSLPVLYAKGNHECRGYFAQKLYKYLVFNTNEFYCQWDYGPVSGITIDIGEDKEDDHEEYYGVDDMDHYFEEQYKWLENMGGYTEGSQYHLSISHSPTFIDRYLKEDYIQLMKQYETDFHICGHTHWSRFEANGRGNSGIPTLHDGGHDDNTTMRTTLLTISNGNYHYVGYSASGTTLLEGDVSANRKGSSASATVSEDTEASVNEEETEESVIENTTENAEEPVIPTAAGVSTLSLKGAGDSISITAKPVVFDCGDYYCVVWQTTEGQECAGYVEINGVEKSYMDSFAGKLRTETTHSVKIPKDVLDGKTFTVKNRLVTNYAMYGLKSNPPTSYGPYVSNTAIKFLGDSDKKLKSYNILVLSDIADKGIDANKVKSSFTGNPALIVSLGNMVKSFNTEADFGEYLKYMNTVSNGGAIPVLFLRGENETKGTFAANISRYIRNTTSDAVIGKFYTNAAMGEVAFAGLDTATDSADSTAKYNQYASFDNIRAEQVSWMQNTIGKTFKDKYNLVFAHGDGLDNYLGVNFTKGFTNLGTNLVVTGGAGKAPSYSGGTSSYATATCGTATGIMLTCKNDEIVVKTIGDDAAQLGTVDVTKAVASGNSGNSDSDDKDDDSSIDNSGDSGNSGNSGNNNNQNGNSNNGSSDKNNSTTNNGTTTGKPNSDNSYSGSGNGTTTYEPGEFDGIDGDMYIRVVPDGWYNDYLGSGFTYAVVTTVSANGTAVTEEVFIELISNLAGINLTLYSDSTNAEKAASWAEEYGVYSGYIGGDNALTDSVIKSVLDGLFAA